MKKASFGLKVRKTGPKLRIASATWNEALKKRGGISSDQSKDA